MAGAVGLVAGAFHSCSAAWTLMVRLCGGLVRGRRIEAYGTPVWVLLIYHLVQCVCVQSDQLAVMVSSYVFPVYQSTHK